MKPDLVVSEAQQSDLQDLAAVHASAFPEFFLTSLGSAVLTALYDAMRCSGKCIVLVARDKRDGRVVGFAAGSADGGNLRSILVRSPRFVFSVGAAILHRPALLAKVLRRHRRFRRADSRSGTAALWSIAVHSELAGCGVGSRLLHEFESRCLKVGAAQVVLTTDGNGNEGAVTFYQRHGYRVLCEHSEDARRLLLFGKRLDQARPSKLHD